MRLLVLIFILFTLTLNAIALEVILNPYEDIHEGINTYEIGREEEIDDCSCHHRDWWE